MFSPEVKKEKPLTMRFRYVPILVVLTSLVAGCGSGTGDVPTDPSQLKPLTEAEKAEIKKQDESVAAEEGQSINFGKKAK